MKILKTKRAVTKEIKRQCNAILAKTCWEHEAMVRELKKPGVEILTSLTSKKCALLHMAFALPGEVGELCDAIKRHIFYGQDLDLENVQEEIGDCEFYMEGIRQAVGLHRVAPLVANISKLRVRYGKRYSNEKAKLRLDKKGK